MAAISSTNTLGLIPAPVVHSSSSISSPSTSSYSSTLAESELKSSDEKPRFCAWEIQYNTVRKYFEEIANTFTSPIPPPAVIKMEEWFIPEESVDVNKEMQRLFKEVHRIAKDSLSASPVEKRFSDLNSLLSELNPEQRREVFIDTARYFAGARTQEEIDAMSTVDPSLNSDDLWYSSYESVVHDFEDMIDILTSRYELDAQSNSSDLEDMVDDSPDGES